MTVPQIGGMYEGDMSRKRMLMTMAFGCGPMDNRPPEVGGIRRSNRSDDLLVGPHLGCNELAKVYPMSSNKSSARPDC